MSNQSQNHSDREPSSPHVPSDILAQLEVLIEEPSRYFRITDDAVMIPVGRLVPTRARRGGILSANRYMRASWEGKHDRRKPITVREGSDGTYLILDGNSTYANAVHSGWTVLPCTIVTDAEEATG